MTLLHAISPIISLILCVVFFKVFAKKLKEKPSIFYIVTALLIIISLAIMFTAKHGKGVVQPWYTTLIYLLFGRGTFGTSMFIVIMFIGALPSTSKLRKIFMPIRSEMSIMAGFFVLVHNLVFGRKYFVMLFTAPGELSPVKLAATIVSFTAVVLLIILLVTSFPKIRKKMLASSWKKLQRLAYPYYYLVYIHIMILYVSKVPVMMAKQSERLTLYIIGIAFYTIIYATYTVMKIKKDKFGLAKN